MTNLRPTNFFKDYFWTILLFYANYGASGSRQQNRHPSLIMYCNLQFSSRGCNENTHMPALQELEILDVDSMERGNRAKNQVPAFSLLLCLPLQVTIVLNGIVRKRNEKESYIYNLPGCWNSFTVASSQNNLKFSWMIINFYLSEMSNKCWQEEVLALCASHNNFHSSWSSVWTFNMAWLRKRCRQWSLALESDDCNKTKSRSNH